MDQFISISRTFYDVYTPKVKTSGMVSVRGQKVLYIWLILNFRSGFNGLWLLIWNCINCIWLSGLRPLPFPLVLTLIQAILFYPKLDLNRYTHLMNARDFFISNCMTGLISFLFVEYCFAALTVFGYCIVWRTYVN